MGSAAMQAVQFSDGSRSWTVVGADHLPIEPVEAFLEYGRTLRQSPNTTKAYARALQLYWAFLSAEGTAWDDVTIDDLGRFLQWLRSGDEAGVVALHRDTRFAESTVQQRLAAISSFYRYHHFNGVPTASRLYERVFRPGLSYRPMLEHVARRKGRERNVLSSRRANRTRVPTLTLDEIAAILDACARWDPQRSGWVGSVRDRLLWSLLADTGMRIGEALGVRHCDWTTGTGDPPFVEIVPREHAHGVRVKGDAYRKLYMSDRTDQLYGEWLWQLCELGADEAHDEFADSYVFVALRGQNRFGPLTPSSVYGLVDRLRSALSDVVSPGWTPHWFRHTHATALLLTGTPLHVVSRRLGHCDVQTTLNTYAWVTDDAELRAACNWELLTKHWEQAT